jgi:hypothetical protein
MPAGLTKSERRAWKRENRAKWADINNNAILNSERKKTADDYRVTQAKMSETKIMASDKPMTSKQVGNAFNRTREATVNLGDGDVTVGLRAREIYADTADAFHDATDTDGNISDVSDASAVDVTPMLDVAPGNADFNQHVDMPASSVVIGQTHTAASTSTAGTSGTDDEVYRADNTDLGIFDDMGEIPHTRAYRIMSATNMTRAFIRTSELHVNFHGELESSLMPIILQLTSGENEAARLQLGEMKTEAPELYELFVKWLKTVSQAELDASLEKRDSLNKSAPGKGAQKDKAPAPGPGSTTRSKGRR